MPAPGTALEYLESYHTAISKMDVSPRSLKMWERLQLQIVPMAADVPARFEDTDEFILTVAYLAAPGLEPEDLAEYDKHCATVILGLQDVVRFQGGNPETIPMSAPRTASLHRIGKFGFEVAEEMKKQQEARDMRDLTGVPENTEPGPDHTLEAKSEASTPRVELPEIRVSRALKLLSQEYNSHSLGKFSSNWKLAEEYEQDGEMVGHYVCGEEDIIATVAQGPDRSHVIPGEHVAQRRAGVFPTLYGSGLRGTAGYSLELQGNKIRVRCGPELPNGELDTNPHPTCPAVLKEIFPNIEAVGSCEYTLPAPEGDESLAAARTELETAGAFDMASPGLSLS